MMNDLPIPGENFTSDTKGYPWHSPPEFTAVGPALDKMSHKMTDRKTAPMLMSMVETGLPLYKLSQIIIMEGLSNGKWTLDLGLLLAGPITKILEIMCQVYDVTYTIGIEDEDDTETGLFAIGVENLKKNSRNQNVFKVIQDELPKIEEQAEGQPSGVEGAATEGEPETDLGEQGFATMMSSSDGSDKDSSKPEENAKDTK